MAGGVLGSRQRCGCQANGSLRLAGSHIVSLVTGENGFEKQEQSYQPVGGGVGGPSAPKVPYWGTGRAGLEKSESIYTLFTEMLLATND
ncbi:hypothetical protein FOXG_21983 [Fusarium oxysporum f. sp. lycopersici 4287]|uniref:Uncharacterized protein n=1 Tax=Fusarium oxysporum f. sp. lycopersici (strain 4287 / CBS 123668 / FGSC 9935 / NRRL 34936) TaxID=426428 RepID=A0A0J9W141_FUSO4|nr:hypothetical protein FOXG_21703 [Fusarium oxysporum f. sp. lycopersici 4287]XP_018255656.1 hypothetical protein FOXG_21983 [Fusarium oxysporum f. sp. lycopersici 4287]KNB16545.1 hypothetical protein FOXG_21703 [Fusarium oxysporum f. sp. lycopersici 4287]KNB17611.1 hypothetical protein FOXG_21983 [Fusarium oxysporum f. sp. lycopersici 4287]